MKTTLTLAELRAYYEKEKPSKIIYCSENQEEYDDWEPCSTDFTFHTMYICMFPNNVFLKSDSGTMCMRSVCRVEIDTEESILGAVLTITCRRYIGTPSTQKFVFILQ